MNQVTRFKDLGIKPKSTNKPLTGEKIKIDKIIGKEIKVFDYSIKPSKFKDKGNGKCLTLQFEFKEEMRVLFTSSVILQDSISQIQKDRFPFLTIIEKIDGYLQFT